MLREDAAAEVHSLFHTGDGSGGEDVFGAFFPGSDGPAELDFFTPDETDEDVETTDRE